MARTLVALPGAHNASVATLLYCLLLRADIKLLSSQRGTEVLDAIEEFRPTTVLAFAGTFGEMAAEDLAARDLSSVEVWFNTGDAAHEAHIRALVRHGSHEEIGRDGGICAAAGSRAPSSSTGSAPRKPATRVFHNRHTKDTSAYSRCVGKPISFAEAAVLAEDGTPLPPGRDRPPRPEVAHAHARLLERLADLEPDAARRLLAAPATSPTRTRRATSTTSTGRRTPSGPATGSSSAPAPRSCCCGSCPNWPTARWSGSPRRAYGRTGTATAWPTRTRCSSSARRRRRQRRHAATTTATAMTAMTATRRGPTGSTRSCRAPDSPR